MATDGAGYRPVSAPAVVAVIAGVLSALALASPFFWIIPLLGIAVACLGLADVRRPGAEKAGRLAALLGLALSIGFGAQAISTAVTTRLVTDSRARAVAERWLEAIRSHQSTDAESMCQPEAIAAVATIGARWATCERQAFQLRVGGASEDVSGGVVVRATMPPCRDDGTASATMLTIHVVPAMEMRQGRTVERWTIARCDIE